MSDVLSAKQRSFCMSQIKGSKTKPEIMLRKALWNIGLRYRIKNKLPGKPDIVFASKRTVIFVDGCFWHKCPDHYVEPKTRNEFWVRKIERNCQRDIEVTDLLNNMGWQVLRFWEHEIKNDLDKCVSKIEESLSN